MKLKLLLAALMLTIFETAATGGTVKDSACDTTALSHRWALSTNIPTWALLGTLNADAQLALDTHWSIRAGIKYNPFTFHKGDGRQFHLRQATPSVGVRYWFDSVYEGWFVGGKLMGSVYSVANICGSGCFDGQLAAIGIGAGWSKPLSERWALCLGTGAAVALHDTTYYAGPSCGRILGAKRGLAVFVPDVFVSVNYLL